MLVREIYFCNQAGLIENKQLNLNEEGFCFFSFSNFTFGFHGFQLKKLKISQYDSWNWRAEENLVVNNKDNRVFMSRNYRSGSCPLEI